jgi:hypothetical protein
MASPSHPSGSFRQWLSVYSPNGQGIWGPNRWGVSIMLQRLKAETGLPCNARTFRRTFAVLLRKAGVDCLTIRNLGRWVSVRMVERYTGSTGFQDAVKFHVGWAAIQQLALLQFPYEFANLRVS